MRRIVIAIAMVTMLAASAEAGTKKRQTAMLLAGGGTALSGGLMLSSVLFAPSYGDISLPLFYTGLGTSLFTPSLGQWYAGQYLTIGMAVRAGAVGIAIAAIATQYETTTCDAASSSTQTCQRLQGNGVALLVLAAIAYVGGAAYDVLDAPDAVDRWNRAHGGIVLTPTTMRGVNGAPVGGLALAGTF